MTTEPESIAWQADSFGQKCNDEFLASEADALGIVRTNTRATWADDMAVEYAKWDNGQEGYERELTDEIENALSDAGYTVIWDNGVFIYRTEDLPEDTEGS